MISKLEIAQIEKLNIKKKKLEVREEKFLQTVNLYKDETKTKLKPVVIKLTKPIEVNTILDEKFQLVSQLYQNGLRYRHNLTYMDIDTLGLYTKRKRNKGKYLRKLMQDMLLLGSTITLTIDLNPTYLEEDKNFNDNQELHGDYSEVLEQVLKD